MNLFPIKQPTLALSISEEALHLVEKALLGRLQPPQFVQIKVGGVYGLIQQGGQFVGFSHIGRTGQCNDGGLTAPGQ